MTTTSEPAIMNSSEARLDSIVVEIRKGLQEINKQIELQPKTDLQEASAIIDALQARKEQWLAKWLMLATKVRDQISQIAQRSSDDDYREIVPLVEKLDTWSQDTALVNESDAVNQLKTITDESRAIQGDVRRRLVGDREEQAREYLAMADQAIEQPFVRVWPLLRAKLLWREVARIVDGVESEPSELESTQEQLDKLNGAIRYEMSTVREKETQQFANELETRWRQATEDKNDEVIEETLRELRRILACSPQVNVSQEFLDVCWEREYDDLAVKMSQSRVRGLLRRVLDPEMSIPKVWMELQEARQLSRTLDSELVSEVQSAEEMLTERIVKQLEAHSTSVRAAIDSQSYDNADLELGQISELMPYVDDIAEWKQRFTELQAEYDAKISPFPETSELKKFLDYLNGVNEADDKLDALSLIGYYKGRIPKDLSRAPANIRSDIIAAINRVLISLPTGDMQGFGAVRKNYLEQIKRIFDKSLQVP